MTRQTSLLTIILAFGVCGCGPDPEVVSINWSRLQPQTEITVVPTHRPQRVVVQGSSATIPVSPQKQLYVDSAQGRAESALDLIRAEQERAFRQIVEDLRRAYSRDVARWGITEAERIDASYEAQLDQAYADFRAVFERYTPELGELWIEIANLAGFPDPDPKSKRVPRQTDQVATKRFERSKVIRTRIQELANDYRREIESVLANLQRARLEALSDRDTRLTEMQQEREQEALAQARAIVQVAVGRLEATALDPRQVLPTVPAESVAIPAAEASTFGQRFTAPPQRESEAQIRKRVDIFLAVRHYKLGQKGRDVTDEFLTWQRTFRASNSAQ